MTWSARLEGACLLEDPRKMVFLILPAGAGADLLYRRSQGSSPKLANIAHSPAELVDVVAHG